MLLFTIGLYFYISNFYEIFGSINAKYLIVILSFILLVLLVNIYFMLKQTNTRIYLKRNNHTKILLTIVLIFILSLSFVYTNDLEIATIKIKCLFMSIYFFATFFVISLMIFVIYSDTKNRQYTMPFLCDILDILVETAYLGNGVLLLIEKMIGTSFITKGSFFTIYVLIFSGWLLVYCFYRIHLINLNSKSVNSTAKLSFDCFIKSIENIKQIEDKGYYSHYVINEDKLDYLIFNVDLSPLCHYLFNSKNCYVTVTNLFSYNVDNTKPKSQIYLALNKKRDKAYSIKMVLKKNNKKYFVVLLIESTAANDQCIVTCRRIMTVKPIILGGFYDVKIENRVSNKYFSLNSIVIDDETSEEINKLSKAMNEPSIGGQKFYFHNGKYGTGKTLTDIFAISASGNSPVLISGWSSGAEGDIIRYIYSKIVLKSKRKSSLSYIEANATFLSMTGLLLIISNMSGIVIIDVVATLLNCINIHNDILNLVITLLIIVIVPFVLTYLFSQHKTKYISSQLKANEIEEDYYCDKICEVMKKHTDLRLVIEDIDRLQPDQIVNIFSKLNLLNIKLSLLYHPKVYCCRYDTICEYRWLFC